MTDSLGRRGFTQAVLVAGASIWLPRAAFAAESRIALVGTLVPRLRDDALSLELALRNDGRDGIELLATAATLGGTLRIGNHIAPVSLASEDARFRSRSRAGFRLGRRLVLPPNEVVRYDEFTAPWPDSIAPGGRAALVLQVVTVDLETRPEAERPGLRALGTLCLRANITRPS